MTVQCTLLRRVQRWPCLSQQIHADGALTMLRLNGGVEARTQFGDDTVSGTELGQADTTTLDNDAFTGGAFLGLSGENPAQLTSQPMPTLKQCSKPRWHTSSLPTPCCVSLLIWRSHPSRVRSP